MPPLKEPWSSGARDTIPGAVYFVDREEPQKAVIGGDIFANCEAGFCQFSDVRVDFLAKSKSRIHANRAEDSMRPWERRESGEQDLFRARLDQIIDLNHELAKLARRSTGASSRTRIMRPPAGGYSRTGNIADSA
jgi:hypothetical protein